MINNPVHANATTAVGAALGELIAANAPALRDLRVSSCLLGDAGLAPLVAALPHNTHLVKLRCEDNDMSDAFARDHFLPAIRANTSLRVLQASDWWGGEEDGIAPDEVLQAEALVKARADADAVPP
jgi:Ran GTPase-activating protein (RanGAP) involved in mRNA processing and transport